MSVQQDLATAWAWLQSRDCVAVWVYSPEPNKWLCQAISVHIPLQTRKLHFSVASGWQTTMEGGEWPWWLQWHGNQLWDRNWFWKYRPGAWKLRGVFRGSLIRSTRGALWWISLDSEGGAGFQDSSIKTWFDLRNSVNSCLGRSREKK